MLSVSRIGSPGAAASYYSKEDYAAGAAGPATTGEEIAVVDPSGDVVKYYAVAEDELGTPLHWEGEGAAQLGLDGAADEAEFKAALLGINPDGEGEAISKREVALRKEADAERDRANDKSDTDKEREDDAERVPAWSELSLDERIARAEASKERHAAGWDLTFSAPKSLSVMALDADGDPRLRETHGRAVDVAMAYVEQHFSVYRVREPGGERREQISGNLLIARTTHSLSRAGDPNLHDHVIVLNATRDAEGTWRALETEHLYRHMKLAGAIYQAELRNQAKDLGYDVRDGETLNTFELAAVSPEVVLAHSTRGSQIRKTIQDMEADKGRALSDAERHAAVLKDRPAKSNETADALRHRWSETNECLGIDVAELVPGAGAVGKDRTPAINSPAREILERVKDLFRGDRDAYKSPDSALAFGRDAAFHSTTVSTQHDMLFWSMIANGNRLRLSDYLNTGFFVRPEFLQADKKVLAGVTTQETIDRERAINAHIVARQGRAIGFGASEVARHLSPDSLSARGAKFDLTDDQRQAVTVALASKDGVVAIQGFAGTGKTTAFELLEASYRAFSALSDVRGRLGPAGPPVVVATGDAARAQELNRLAGGLKGAAPTHAAVKELTDKGIRADTLSAILSRYAFAKERAPALLTRMRREYKGSYLLIDETSMLGNQQLETVFRMQTDLKIEKVILAGDIRQIASLQAGAPFKMGMEHNPGMARAELTTIMRQDANPTLKQAVVAFAQGKGAEGLNRIRDMTYEIGRGASDDALADKAFVLWKERDGQTKVIVDTNKMRGLVNGRIREALAERGDLKGQAFGQPTFRDAGLSAHEKRLARRYEPGQVVYFFGDAGKFKTDDTLTVTAMDTRRNQLVGTDREGKEVRLDLGMSDKAGELRVGVYRPSTTEFQVGERVLFNKTDKPRSIRTSDEFEIVGFGDDKVSFRSAADDRRFEIPRKDTQLEFMTYAYAVTADKAQGKSFASVVAVLKSVGQGDFVNQARAYIMTSRAKDDFTLVTDSFKDLLRKVAEHDGIKLIGLDNLKDGKKDKGKDQASTEKSGVEDMFGKTKDEHKPNGSTLDAPLTSKAERYMSDGARDIGDKTKAMDKPQPERSM